MVKGQVGKNPPRRPGPSRQAQPPLQRLLLIRKSWPCCSRPQLRRRRLPRSKTRLSKTRNKELLRPPIARKKSLPGCREIFQIGAVLRLEQLALPKAGFRRQ